jgi:hypothetical protein
MSLLYTEQWETMSKLAYLEFRIISSLYHYNFSYQKINDLLIISSNVNAYTDA